MAPGDDKDARALLYRLGPERFVDRVLLAWTRSPASSTDTAWHSLATLPQRWTAPAFPLKADDFLQRGLAKGPALGVALRAAEEAWIAADFPADPGGYRVDSRHGCENVKFSDVLVNSLGPRSR